METDSTGIIEHGHGLEKSQIWPAVGLWLAITAVLAGAAYAMIINLGFRPYTALLMWTPGVAALMTVKMLGLPLGLLALNWPKSRYILIGAGLPILYGLAAYGMMWSTGLAGLVNPKFLDHAHSVMNLPQGWSDALTVVTVVLITGTTWIMWHIPTTLGEELGWRSFLTPLLMEKMGLVGTCVVSGVIWTLWSLPLLIFTDYGGGASGLDYFNYALLLFSLGVIMILLRIASGSVWPAVFLHAFHNFFILETLQRMLIEYDDTPFYAGEYGLVLPLVVALIAGTLLWRATRRRLTAPHGLADAGVAV